MASTGSKITKRLDGDLEGSIEEPTSKRHEVDPRSLETAIRNPFEALIETIRKAEEVFHGQISKIPKQPKLGGDRSREKKLAENGVPDGPTYIYVVHEKSYVDCSIFDAEIVRYYATRSDANNMVRTLYAACAERADPHAEFNEGKENDGRIWRWYRRNEYGYVLGIEIVVESLQPLDSVPARDWGRDIGGPCPDPSDEKSLEDDD